MRFLLHIILIGLMITIIMCQFSYAQQPEKEEEQKKIEQKIENIVEDISDEVETEEEVDFTQLFDDLQYYKDKPLNLNTATAEELENLVFLNDIQINNLLIHRLKNGKLISIYELQAVEGFDMETIRNILPYIEVKRNPEQRFFSLKEMFREGQHQYFLRVQQPIQQYSGYEPIEDSLLAEKPNSRYLGNSMRVYSRYRFKYYNNISWGITMEKDPGEPFFSQIPQAIKDTMPEIKAPKGFDFYSAHFFLKDFGNLKALAVGDYHVQFGQGLTAWTGLSFGKSSDVMSVKKNAKGVLPYTSVDENNFMRGAAATFALSKFEISGFYSQNQVDGNKSAADTLDQETFFITSLQQTGIHAKPSEILDKDAIYRKSYGMHLGYKIARSEIGVTAMQNTLEKKLKRSLKPYNQFEFSGDNILNLGLDYSFLFRNMNFFGEAARSDNGGTAFLNGLLISLDSWVALSIVHRKYSKDYQFLYAAAFAEGSKPANEEGLYTGFEARWGKKWRFSAYADHFFFPWMRYRVDKPGTFGKDYLLQTKYRPSRKLEMYLRFRQENKFLNNAPEDVKIDFPEQTSKQIYRYHTVYKISPSITLKNRIEMNNFRKGTGALKNGYLIYQDVSFRTLNSPLAFSTRYAIFDTDDYDTRIYAYENDVLYAYSIPAYYYRGSRFYLLLQYRLSRAITFWIRYAQSFYDNKDITGSGLNETEGNIRSEIKAQIRIKF